MTDRYLEGRTAWVTGGASGMGKACALALAERGADVAVGSLVVAEQDNLVDKQKVHLVTEEELAGTGAEIESRGVRSIASALDVCSNKSVDAFFATVLDTFGKLDILVNAAGTFGVHVMVNHPDVLWDRVLDINLNGPYRTIKRCLPAMIERGWGRIINIASTGANIGADDHDAYCASKSGVLGLTRCVALEGAPHGVTCNAVNPGWVATPMNRLRLEEKIEVEQVDISVEQYRDNLAAGYPQKRLVQPVEIGALSAFLCREEALGISGEDITVAAGSLW